MEARYFFHFEATMRIVNWAELDSINDHADECLKYLGNHNGDDEKTYAIFSGEGVLCAVPIPA